VPFTITTSVFSATVALAWTAASSAPKRMKRITT